MSDPGNHLSSSPDGKPANPRRPGNRPAGFTLSRRYEGLSISIWTGDGPDVVDIPLTRKDALHLANSILHFYAEDAPE